MLIVGLGNPGKEYASTRHNLGFRVVEALGEKLNLPWKMEGAFKSKVAKGEREGQNVHLLLPMTYMNLSGWAVRRYIDYFKLSVSSLVVVLDDVDLPFGVWRWREGGSSGGHNGLKSIEAALGTSSYKRLRMGIGHPGEMGLADYVLEPFTSAEEGALPPFIEEAVARLQQEIKILGESHERKKRASL